ncbi:MAG: type II toxin-antitoxin system VapC family toxin [Holophagales bacterium]|nr:type II toxin-antitoxin system VapC family toxin [Holophagales bacterium]MYF96661.1 type II toxin-antitoxin system VapC family toxin [Holophagales bacterium]
MTRRFGIDTSVLVRLLTGEPREDFLDCVAALISLVEHEGSEIFASNQVIGEAYVAVQHHYRVSKPDARAGLLDVLRSGLVSPLNGRAVFDALEAAAGPGLFDRLIADDYSRTGLAVLTLDRRMADLAGVSRLSVPGG